jgi:hypothetical protein
MLEEEAAARSYTGFQREELPLAAGGIFSLCRYFLVSLPALKQMRAQREASR